MAYIGADFKLEKPIEECVLYDKPEPHIARITLNRPEKGNSLYMPDSCYRIAQLLREAGDDDQVKVIVLRGNAPSFCSGGDVARLPAETWGMRPDAPRPPQSVRLLGIH